MQFWLGGRRRGGSEGLEASAQLVIAGQRPKKGLEDLIFLKLSLDEIWKNKNKKQLQIFFLVIFSFLMR